ncbi:PorP/SprF family type IX secretion system membrane protein [Terrimonas pollutisoli]|uniref:PorP/SprF family type IX secretion system membrane protein n=1 Tax=Terrimonas pollutisoli TaxID=3034147 RepID=UPI0023EB5224|nr:PorP/SprF family type IX secretion system membrane protein [Terrimonas sp. H1YJ31]
MKRIINSKMVLTILFVSLKAIVHAQDIHFSQFFETPLLRNPALAGIYTGDIRVQMVYREQWGSVTDGYKTGSLNGEYKLPIGKADDFITVGGQVLFDRAGTAALTQTSILPVVNYHKSLSDDESNRYLSLGFMGGVVNRHFDQSKVITDDPNGEPTAIPRYTYLDGSVGLSYNSNLNKKPDDNFYIGVAYHHFTKPKNTFFRDPSVKLNPKWTGSAGFRFGVSEYAYVSILADYSIQENYKEAVVGALYGLKIGPELDNPKYTIHAGSFIRWDDALIPVVKLDYAPFAFALSYDVNISKLKPYSNGRGGFELSVSYIGFLDRDNSSLNAVKCPRF